ncbi:DUF55-domain-containing protein [Trametopsis cervina]|nr:DUF55-domain-containing protein [Trametopsis cervina]
MVKHWLMKAEPDSRIVKGKDVKFSVDDFESMKTTPWEGVRNAEARNLMKEMRVGDKVLFYHSNCKNPGIAAFAEVSKEAYPDYTAWDVSHPYYDAKTDKDKPKWYMVELTFKSRAANFVPLSLLRRIAAAPGVDGLSDVSFIGPNGFKAIKEMALVSRGRLSVQRVEETAWGTIEQLAKEGGWDDGANKKVKQRKMKLQGEETKSTSKSSNADTRPAVEGADRINTSLRRSSRARGPRS